MTIYNRLFNFAFTEASFKVTPEELVVQSEEVRGSIDRITARFENMDRISRSTAGYWNGDAAEHFRGCYENFAPELNQMFARMLEHVDDLKRMAGVYENAEAAAEEIISSLPSDVII